MIDLVNSPDEQVVRSSFLFTSALFTSALTSTKSCVFSLTDPEVTMAPPPTKSVSCFSTRFLAFCSRGRSCRSASTEPDADRDALLICRSESRVLCTGLRSMYCAMYRKSISSVCKDRIELACQQVVLAFSVSLASSTSEFLCTGDAE